MILVQELGFRARAQGVGIWGFGLMRGLGFEALGWGCGFRTRLSPRHEEPRGLGLGFRVDSSGLGFRA